MTTATLYELTDLRLRIDAALEESEGVLDDTVAKALDRWEVDFPVKVQSCVLRIRDLEGDAEKIHAEIERLQKKKASLLGDAKWLTEYVARNMEALKLEEAGGPLGSAKFAKTPPSVQEVVPTDEPDFRNLMVFAPEFVSHTPAVYTWDKNAIKAAHKAGTLPPEVAKRVKITQGKRLALK